mgnify:FL=1
MGHRAYQLNYTHDEDGVGYWEALYSHNGALLAFDDTLPSDLDDVIPLPCEPTTYKSPYTSRCVKPTGEGSEVLDRFEKMHDLDSMIRHMGSAALQEVLWVNYGPTRGYSTYLPVRILWPHEIKESVKKDDVFIGLVGNVFQRFLENMEGYLAFYIQADKQSRFIELREMVTIDGRYDEWRSKWNQIKQEGLYWYEREVFNGDEMRKVMVTDKDIQGLVSIWMYELANWWLDELYMMFYDPTAEIGERMSIVFPSFSPMRWESEPYSEGWNNLGIVNQGWLRTDGEPFAMKKVIPAEIIRNLPEGYLDSRPSSLGGQTRY